MTTGQNSWARDRLRFMDPRWGSGNPAEAFGFRLITGVRLEEAKLRSKDALDLLRWVYIPIYDSLDGMCVQMRPDFHRGTDLRAIHAVMVTGGTLHLMTVEFEQRFQERRQR